MESSLQIAPVAGPGDRRALLTLPYRLYRRDPNWVPRIWSEQAAWLERRNYKMHLRVLLARYRAYDECPDCRGRRLRPEALAVSFRGESIASLCQP